MERFFGFVVRFLLPPMLAALTLLACPRDMTLFPLLAAAELAGRFFLATGRLREATVDALAAVDTLGETPG